ncbi:MAG TPA: fumarylacetoacetate hydrolase family protein [Burkholderiales bacterium]|jgi:2-keto-4-pentenoate hydratase|nr:fumarylacetoacetate hydrolase family protein [Burkholderiales bacterium]
MNRADIDEAAAILWTTWDREQRLEALPPQCRPVERADGYAIQAAVARKSGSQLFGWKIAATSRAGQRHIGVDGPLAGRLLSQRVVTSGATVSLANNQMRVAEAEFAFRMGKALAVRQTPYSIEEVMAAVETLHTAIEIPDSRFRDFTKVGAAQLIADNACACWFVIGPEAPSRWRQIDLAEHAVTVQRNGQRVVDGKGHNVLGDPRVALVWIANELSAYGEQLNAGDVITTGTCVTPVQIFSEDRVLADFGVLGQVEARLN